MSQKNYEVVNKMTFLTREEGTKFAMGYKAELNIKVGNLVAKICIYKDSNADDAQTCVGDSELDMLKKVGMEFDWSDIIAAYDKALPEMKAKEGELKLRKYRAIYKKSWMIEQNVKQFERPDKGLTIVVESEDDFVKRVANNIFNQEPKVSIKYREQEVFVSFTNVSTDRYSSRRHGDMKYQIDHSLTDHKRRNYAKFETVVDKVIELTDDMFNAEIAKQERLSKEKADRQEKLKMLTDEFGKFATPQVKQEYKSAGHGRGWHEWEYQLVVEKGETKRTLKISFHKTDDEHKTFRFAGLGVLTSIQIRQILEIL